MRIFATLPYDGTSMSAQDTTSGSVAVPPIQSIKIGDGSSSNDTVISPDAIDPSIVVDGSTESLIVTPVPIGLQPDGGAAASSAEAAVPTEDVEAALATLDAALAETPDPNPASVAPTSPPVASDQAPPLETLPTSPPESADISAADTPVAAPDASASATPTSADQPAPTPQPPPDVTTSPLPSQDPTTPPLPTADFSNLLEVLVSTGDLTKAAADKIQVDNISTGEPIESLLTKENLVNEVALTKAKSILNKVPFIDLSQVGIYPEALTRLPEGVARSYKMLPFEYNKEEGTLSVAMVDPLDLSAVDFAQQKTGLRIAAHYALPSELDRLLAEYYSQSLSSEVTEALAQTTQAGTDTKKNIDYSKLSRETIRQAPIAKIVETILTFAIKARASDVHIEPLEEHTRVRYRIDGILTEKLILPRSVHDAVVSRIKILSGLKIDEKRMPQDGRFNFVALEQEVDLRVSTLPTIHGEKIVMRLLKKDQKVPTMPELGLDGLALRHVQDAIKVPHGIILITGPTGSGKTTTLYSILHVINSPKVNIMTLEDPVEYQMLGVNQVQINPQAGLTFASGLRSFLRQDPNIIMVGEIRDSETAELAIQASLTGHLVFSTLHTSSAAGAIPRLMDMGAEPFLLASSMTLVMGQRVMRVINADYKEEYKPDPVVIEDFKTVLGDRFDAWCKQKGKRPEDITLMRPSKNRPQTEPEFKGRVAIFEVMRITEQISQLIVARKTATEMEKLALKDGMLLMKQDGYLKALEGITTIEEVLRVAQI